MVKKLIFVGGSKGVGKTSLAKFVSQKLGFDYVHTGELFRKHRLNFDEEFANYLIRQKSDLIVDTHYAVSSRRTPYKLYIGMGEKSQKRLSSESNYLGKIILIEAEPSIVLERRIEDNDERRCLELSQIIKENYFNRIYSQIYASCLNLLHVTFDNSIHNLTKSKSKFLELIKNE